MYTCCFLSRSNIILAMNPISLNVLLQRVPAGVLLWVHHYYDMVNCFGNCVFSFQVDPCREVHQSFLLINKKFIEWVGKKKTMLYTHLETIKILLLKVGTNFIRESITRVMIKLFIVSAVQEQSIYFRK